MCVATRPLMLRARLVSLLLAVACVAAAPPTPVDLNRASIAELMQLPGIGQKRAQDIVRYRSTRPFRKPADLLRVKGIGIRTYQKLKPLVQVGPDTPMLSPAPAAR